MASMGERLIKDLKSDYKKTAVMLVLGVTFFVLLLHALSQEESDPSLALAPGEDSGLSPMIAVRAETDPVETAKELLAPHFLSVALPFKEINKDPFALFFATDDESLVEVGMDETVTRNMEHEEIARREEEILATIKVSGVTRSGRGASALVDGLVLPLHSVHKGFTLEEIGERHVVFSGLTIKRRVEIDL
jgi:hypothetical protein